MKMQIIGIYDRKSQSFVEMSATPHIGVATRNFGEAVNTKADHPAYKWPEDFELWHLGEWDTETGKPTPITDNGDFAKKLIVSGDSIKVR